jgi:hemerythrin-like domain-containing protein
MKACDDLRHEHKIVLLVLQGADALSGPLGNGDAGALARAGEVVDFLRNFVDRCHHAKEERHLFPALTATAGAAAPIAVLLSEHQEGRRLVAEISSALEKGQLGDAAEGLRAYGVLLRAHIDKEEGVLFPLADRALGPDEQQALKQAFDRVEAEEIGEGVHERYHRLAHDLANG